MTSVIPVSLLFMIFFPVISFSQTLWDNTYLSGGIALSKQDRRLFYFPGATGILERENRQLDYEYNLLIQRRIFKLDKVSINLGIGYAESHSTFSRPFSHAALNGGSTEELRYIKNYTINKIGMPISSSFFLNRHESLSLNFNFLPTAVFRKSATDLSLKKRETKWEFEVSGFELHPGVGIKLHNRMWLNTYYRLFYLNKIDEVIFNEILFYQKDPEFLQKKYDTYNPFKMWFTLSYALK